MMPCGEKKVLMSKMIRPAVDPVPQKAWTVQLLVECPGFAEESPYLRPAVVCLLKVRTLKMSHVSSLYQARALRALGLLLYSRILQWEGGRLFDRSAGFFYGNSCNSGTESRKIVSKVGN